MFRSARTAALASLVLFACGGKDNATQGSLSGVPSLGVGGPVGNGDAGTSDGGAADAGADGGSDAGACAGALARPIGVANDHCFSSGLGAQSANLVDSSCNAQLYLNGVLTCAGNLVGSGNAFFANCASLSCSAPFLPGPITCALGGPDAGTCTIDACTNPGDPLCQ